ncbi:MAG: SDR family oxidoreductase [Melioribacteraceae bacterium]|nr:SDR family oxidoreductase [Melioribacteraceae bacterium]
MEIFSLNNKTAIVTGSAGLIGKYHCEALIEAGANVIAVDLNKEKCDDVVKELGRNIYSYKVNITDKNSVEGLKDFTVNNFGGIDILVNNAAINDMVEDPKSSIENSKFENYSLEDWQRSINVNLTGVFLCSQIIGKEMLKKSSGSIINIASTYGLVAPDQSLYTSCNGEQLFYKPPAYSVTKAGVLSLTRYLSSYWGKAGIRVNSLSPGGVENGQDENFINKYSIKTPLGRMAKPYEYKGALIFLASDASSYMTGANLIVDGGWTAW